MPDSEETASARRLQLEHEVNLVVPCLIPTKEDEVRGAPGLCLLQVADDGQRRRGEGAQARSRLGGVGATRQPVLETTPGLRTAQVHTTQPRVAWQRPHSVGAQPPLGSGGRPRGNLQTRKARRPETRRARALRGRRGGSLRRRRALTSPGGGAPRTRGVVVHEVRRSSEGRTARVGHHQEADRPRAPLPKGAGKAGEPQVHRKTRQTTDRAKHLSARRPSRGVRKHAGGEGGEDRASARVNERAPGYSAVQGALRSVRDGLGLLSSAFGT